MALPNPVRQKAARSALADLLVYPRAVYAIHYACQSFYRGEQLRSPRIAAIALRQLEGGQGTSFSIFQEAEPYRLRPEEVPVYLDFLEKELLAKFFDFIRKSRHARFVHWNMRDTHYGFAALEQRSRVLGLEPEAIHERDKLDLASLLPELYGAEYVEGKQKLENLARLNSLAMGGFLPGPAEADAFEENRFWDVLSSTLCKVRLIAEIAHKAGDDTLRTQSSWAVRAVATRIAIQKVRDNPIPSLMATGAGTLVAALKLFDYFVGR